jgi:hypothetical protein
MKAIELKIMDEDYEYLRWLEGKEDAMQAREKLYKASEESIKDSSSDSDCRSIKNRKRKEDEQNVGVIGEVAYK